jgi:hypothetical protein
MTGLLKVLFPEQEIPHSSALLFVHHEEWRFHLADEFGMTLSV